VAPFEAQGKAMPRPYTIFEEFGGTEFGGIFDADKLLRARSDIPRWRSG